jgi:hypothetical protein
MVDQIEATDMGRAFTTHVTSQKRMLHYLGNPEENEIHGGLAVDFKIDVSNGSYFLH